MSTKKKAPKRNQQETSIDLMLNAERKFKQLVEDGLLTPKVLLAALNEMPLGKDLSEETLEQALVKIRKHVEDTGEKVRIEPTFTWRQAETSSETKTKIASPNPKTLMGQSKVPMLSVIPSTALVGLGTAMRHGAYLSPRKDGGRGYGPYNWRDQPIEASVYIDAAMRHLGQWWDGDNDEGHTFVDEEGNTHTYTVNHLSFAMASIAILYDALVNLKMIDDRPKVKNAEFTELLNYHKF